MTEQASLNSLTTVQAVEPLPAEPVRTPYRIKRTGTAECGQPVFTALADNEPQYKQELLDTTGCSHYDSALHLINQACNAQHHPLTDTNVNVFSDLINSVRPQDPLEGMLAVQMVACHNMAMEFASRATIKDQTVAGVDNNLNRSLKLMRLFGQHLEVLNKHRQKGQQTIQVQHVHMNDIKQAIVGSVQAGG